MYLGDSVALSATGLEQLGAVVTVSFGNGRHFDCEKKIEMQLNSITSRNLTIRKRCSLQEEGGERMVHLYMLGQYGNPPFLTSEPFPRK
tara:strand:- start:1727 stop:1993 length:267 start_codon:yes stop_codon:yes gene_type:complete